MSLETLWNGLTIQALVIALLALVVAVLVYYIRRINRQLPPAGALMISGGPRVGERVGRVSATMLSGETAEIGGGSGDTPDTLIFFFSPTCPISRAMLPVVRSFTGGVRTLFVTDVDTAKLTDLASAFSIPTGQVLSSEALGRMFGIGRVPQAVIVAADGTILARGLVNTREHLESLFNAAQTGTPTIQDHLARQQA